MGTIHTMSTSSRTLNPLALWGRSRVDRDASRITTMVINATQELQMGVDWTANTLISDQLQQHEHAPAVFVEAVRDRLRHNSKNVHWLALKLLETCMKNIGQDLRLPRAVATKPLMDALAALAENKRPRSGLFNFRCTNSHLSAPGFDQDHSEQHDVNELARILIRSWAEGFEAVQAEVPLLGEVYLALLRRGLGFPELTSEEKMTFKLPTASQIEVDAIGEQIRLLRDVLSAAGSDAPGDEMARELTAQLEQTREELQRRIPAIQDDGALSIYLHALDQVDGVLQEYWERVREKVENTDQTGSQAVPEASPVSADAQRTEASTDANRKDSELTQYAPSEDSAWPTVPVTQDQTSGGNIDDLLGLISPRSAPSVA